MLPVASRYIRGESVRAVIGSPWQMERTCPRPGWVSVAKSNAWCDRTIAQLEEDVYSSTG